MTAPATLLSILGEDGSIAEGGSVPEALTPDVLRLLYTHMLRQRLLDDLMLTLQRQGRIGFYGAATGQEAAVFGSGYALEPHDWVLPALREGGIALMRGYPLEDYLAQCFGNGMDRSRGRQMPCHYGTTDQNFATLSSPIGNQLPHAAGVAWAMKLRGDPGIAVGYMGDGATSENDFHSALSMAAQHELPAVFFCQNNQWAISVPVERQTAAPSIASRAAAYRMPSARVDGNDVMAVYVGMAEAVARARSGGGPSFIEAYTYRMGAHSTSDDPSRYRDESVTEAWKAKDPIERLRVYLEGANLLSSEENAELTARLGTEIRGTLETVEQAEKAPPLASMFDDVYKTRTWLLEEQAEDAMSRPQRPTGH